MTNEEKELLVAYLIDAGDIDPDGDVEVQSWTGTRSAKTWYPERRTTRPSSEAARVRARSYTDGATVMPTTSPACRSERS